MEKKSNLQAPIELIILIIVSVLLLQLEIDYYIVMGIFIAVVFLLEIIEGPDLDGLGITKKNIKNSINVQIPFTLAGILGLFAFAVLNNYQIGVPNMGFATYWLVSVPLQELIFRGYAQRALRSILPIFWSVLIISLLFSLSHYYARTPHTNILIICTFIAGFAWGYMYEKKRNLLGPIFSHLILGSLIFLILQ